MFSSNVLEHVRELDQLEVEIKRVLRQGGLCVHVLPTHVWRFWTTLSAFPVALQKVAAMRAELRPSLGVGRFFRALGRAVVTLLAPFFPSRHGEKGNVVSELWLFHPSRWRRHFRASGFDIIRDEPMGLQYTGHFLLGERRSLAQRPADGGALRQHLPAFSAQHWRRISALTRVRGSRQVSVTSSPSL